MTKTRKCSTKHTAEQSRLGFEASDNRVLRPPEVPIGQHAADAPQNRIGDAGTKEYVRIGDFESAIPASVYARFENAMDARGGIPREQLPGLIEEMLNAYETRNR